MHNFFTCLFLIFFTDFTLDSQGKSSMAILGSLYTLLSHADTSLSHIIKAACDGRVPGFAVTWVLTWLVHSMSSQNQIARVFDYFLCAHPIAPLYSAVAVSCYDTCRCC
eukprot:TRINITY_DN4349_c0_g1_i9.p2 TRINITY_DN4349_c0_g1~~TRINITY_DN4349_c0_g1_i9.p2  ORF type:complete len:109 (+),score=7.74 TRINITY_DN4349_c0_g1_i9:640-966(+)